MLSLQRTRPTIREFRGPEPGSVAILARDPMNKPADWRIQERISEDASRQGVADQLAFEKKCILVSEWEKASTNKILNKTVQQRMQSERRKMNLTLEERRDRLRNLILEEEQQAIVAMNNSQETTIERQAKLRERSRHLKEEKERERQQLADEKYKQLWRSQCEELRSAISKRTTQDIAYDRLQQVRQKQEQQAQKREEDEFFARMWQTELDKKADREERDIHARDERYRDQMQTLDKQIAALKAKTEEEKKLKIEEAVLIEEMAALRKVEAQKEAAERARQQQENRDLLQTSIRMKMRRRAREIQEQLAFDTMIMEQIIEETRHEAEGDALKRAELARQVQNYREYMARLREEEILREKEMERLADIEVEKQWNLRQARWQKEKEARGALLEQIIEGRKVQLQEKMLVNERLRQTAAAERQEISEQIEKNKILDVQEREARLKKWRDHQSDLSEQIKFNAHMRSLARAEDERENEKMAEAERAYQERIRQVMDIDWVDPKAHPVRKIWVNQQFGGGMRN